MNWHARPGAGHYPLQETISKWPGLLRSAVVLDAYRDAAWRCLGYRKHKGRWMSAAQIEAAKREQDAQLRAAHHWEPLLRKWRQELREPRRRPVAEERLPEVDDIRSIVRVFRDGSDSGDAIAVQFLGQINASGSTRTLAVIAVSCSSKE